MLLLKVLLKQFSQIHRFHLRLILRNRRHRRRHFLCLMKQLMHYQS